MQLIARLLLLLVMWLSVPMFAEPAFAQEQAEQKIDSRKLLVPPKNADGTLKTTPFLESPAQWMADKQRAFYGSMNKSLRDMMLGGTTKAAWWLMAISFLYGIFHAAGPGHGKAVVTSWILATDNDLKRGLVIAGLSALIQALTAIVAVSALLFVFQAGARTIKTTAGYLETASFAMIALMGLYMIWTAFRPHQHDHGHTHDHQAQQDHHHHHHDHHHDHDPHHVHGPNCGHAHVPEPQQLRGEWSLAKAFSLAFAVGIRPCTGALLVLVAANTVGLYWAGIASTLAMGLGVFITIATIATASVYAKSLALKIAAHDNHKVEILGKFMRIGGGAIIAGLGLLFLLGSLKNGGAGFT